MQGYMHVGLISRGYLFISIHMYTHVTLNNKKVNIRIRYEGKNKIFEALESKKIVHLYGYIAIRYLQTTLIKLGE